MPGVGAAIGMDRIIAMENLKHPEPRIIKKPKVYFIQLGFEAKLKSLSVIEILRKARIPIAQSLSKDGLSLQLAAAEKTGIPYVLIFGQKEAMDGTVIVRNMEDRSQDTVNIGELAEYIKISNKQDGHSAHCKIFHNMLFCVDYDRKRGCCKKPE